MKKFLTCLMLLFAASCATAPPVENAPITISRDLGCEEYRRRASRIEDFRERGKALKAYRLCRARVIALAGKYDAADVRRTAIKKDRDPNDAEYLLVRQTFCLFAGKEKLDKCFTLSDRRWAPSAWSLFWRDAVRVATGAVAGFLAGKYSGALVLLFGL